MNWDTICREFGLVGVLAISGTVLLGFLVRAIWEQFKRELEANRLERAEYLTKLDRLTHGIEEHNARSSTFMTGVIEDHQNNSLILKEIVVTLGRINGYRDDHR